MKKLLVLVVALLLTFTLAGCTETEFVEIPTIVVETEIVEVEIPTIVIETEIVEVEKIVIETETVIIELPVIIKEFVEVEKEVIVYVDSDTVSKTLFQTGYSDEVIFVISKGIESYVIEFRYTDTITTVPTFHLSQMEYQYDGVAIAWIFLEEIEGYEGEEVVDYDHFMEKVHDIIDGMTWEEIEEGWDYLYGKMYSIELEYEEVITIDSEFSGTLTMDNYTDILLLEIEEDTEVTITVTTTEDFDINLYFTSFISYDYDDYITFLKGTSSQTYTFAAGTHFLEIENWYDYSSIEYTIEITISGDIV